MSKIKILFVCLGNICRSPAAEAVMKSYITKEQLNTQISCDSAGTANHHEGEPADPRTVEHALRRGHIVDSISRPFNPKKDFDDFHMIIAMDNSNATHLKKMTSLKTHTDKIFMLTDFCSNKKYNEVPDPYYGGPEDFERVMDIIENACSDLIKKIKIQN